MYDAYISYVNDENDRKFANFILKPHLENRYGHKLLLNHTDILPGAGKNIKDLNYQEREHLQIYIVLFMKQHMGVNLNGSV